MKEDFFSLGYKIIPRYAWKLPYRLWTLFNALIYLAAYRGREDPRLGLWLESGEIVTTWGALAVRLDRTVNQVKTDMRNLQAQNSSISCRTSHRSVIVTLSDYEAYQNIASYKPAESQPKTSRKPASSTTVHKDLSTTGEKIHMSSADDPSLPIKPLIELWNKICGPHALARVRKLTEKRRTAARLRLEEIPELEQWRRVFEHIASDPFHLGGNERNWRATFDYIMRPDKAQRILELLEAGESEYYEDKHGY